MVTQTLIQKVQRLEKRLERVEELITTTPKAQKHPMRQPSNGLKMLAGIWAKKPRTKRDLAIVRKQLWNR